jgi:hypothetical protein
MTRKGRPYIDRGKPGELRFQGRTLLRAREPLPVEVRRLVIDTIRRHNTLDPQLQETHRILLRWGESLGTGLPNVSVETREMHFDPLPPDLQQRVDGIVERSPWNKFLVKVYRTALTGRDLAAELGISRTKLISDRASALWYCRGRFEAEGIYG